MVDLIHQYWYFARPRLAQHYLSLLVDGPGDPIALVGQRRIGKTTFLLNDLLPTAANRGFLPIYIDVWQHRADVLEAINYALQEAIDDLDVPDSKVGRRLKTIVKKVGLGGASMELGEEPARRRPASPFILIDWLLKTLVKNAQRPILLVFDEIQELATASDGDNIVSALRSAITKNRNAVRVAFTGSSQEQLMALFSRSRAALYEGASTLAFPHLDADFIQFIAQRVSDRFKKTVGMKELADVFVRVHYQPRQLIDLLLLYSSGNATSLTSLLDARIDDQLTDADFGSMWRSLRPLHQRICLRVAMGEEVSSIAARRAYAQGSNRKGVSPGTVSSAIKAMIAGRVLIKIAGVRGGYALDDPLFAEWLRAGRQMGAS
jgi:hypothetical protein